MEMAVKVTEEARRVIDERSDFSWKEIRALQDFSGKKVLQSEATTEIVNYNTVKGELITSTSIKGKPKRTVLYLHGGGYCIGSCASYRKPIATLSKVTQSQFLLLEYSLAPENRFPCALEEAFEAYCWLLEQKEINPESIIISGDSAGGGLAVALLLLLKEREVAMPAGGVLISPWVDLSHDSCVHRMDSNNLNPNCLSSRFARAYLGDADPKNPLASPYYADCQGLPPCLIMAGGHEPLLEDIRSFYSKCKESGMEVEWDVEEYMPHVYQILYHGLCPEVDKSLDKIKDFIWRKVK